MQLMQLEFTGIHTQVLCLGSSKPEALTDIAI
jgi:hypothetical protein